MHHDLIPTRTASADDLRSLLRRDHERLERLFNDLLCAFEADARADIPRLWNEFDRELRTHLTIEEEQLMPRFLDFNAPEALALLREHDSIRDRLLRLGVGVDLHLTRLNQVDDFVRELREHAKREDALFYRWSEEHVEDPGLRALLKQRVASKD
jgi:hemerythrin